MQKFDSKTFEMKVDRCGDRRPRVFRFVTHVLLLLFDTEMAFTHDVRNSDKNSKIYMKIEHSETEALDFVDMTKKKTI